MDLIKELLDAKTNNLVEERLFTKPDRIEVDPDRDGPYDLARKIVPTLARMTYAHLHYTAPTHENMSANQDDLVEELVKMIDALCDELNDLKNGHTLANVLSRSKP